MGAIGQLGMQAGSQALSGILGLALGSVNDKRQVRQQDRLNKQQLEMSQKMMEYQQQKQLEMWEKTGYGAQIDQMKRAGLNPGMMYGMSGGGAQTIGAGLPSGQGAHAPTGGGEALGMIGMGIQGGLMEAQRKNIEADTKLKEVDAAKRAGVDTEAVAQGITESKTRIEKMKQETSNEYVRNAILEYEKAIKHNELFEMKASQGDRLEAIHTNTKIAFRQLGLIENALVKSGATMADEIETIRQHAIGAGLQNELTQMGIQVDKAQIQKMAADIAQGWEKLDQGDRELKIKNFEAELKQQFPSIMNAAGRIVNDAVESIFRLTTGQPRGNFGRSPNQ